MAEIRHTWALAAWRCADTATTPTITRRRETAALRRQAKTAKLLAENPTLMRRRELEVLEGSPPAAS